CRLRRRERPGQRCTMAPKSSCNAATKRSSWLDACGALTPVLVSLRTKGAACRHARNAAALAWNLPRPGNTAALFPYDDIAGWTAGKAMPSTRPLPAAYTSGHDSRSSEIQSPATSPKRPSRHSNSAPPRNTSHNVAAAVFTAMLPPRLAANSVTRPSPRAALPSSIECPRSIQVVCISMAISMRKSGRLFDPFLSETQENLPKFLRDFAVAHPKVMVLVCFHNIGRSDAGRSEEVGPADVDVLRHRQCEVQRATVPWHCRRTGVGPRIGHQA